mgnify:CR=1 FL=1
MTDDKGPKLISSVELQTEAGISRATMNNYIKMGLIPKPLIRKPINKKIKAKRIGYFQASALDAVKQIKLYKRDGHSMQEITARFSRLSGESFGYPDTDNHNNNTTACKTVRNASAIIPLDAPSFFDVAVLSACLNDSARICAELPADVYFKILAKFRIITEEVSQHFSCIVKKSTGSQTVCYFLKNFDKDYLINVLVCAAELRKRMINVKHELEIAKEWIDNLFLNIGISAGNDFLGIISSSFADEIIAIGSSESYAISLSQIGFSGSILTTKELINKMSVLEKKKISYGVRKKIDDSPIAVENIFTRVMDFLPHDDPRYKKFTEINELTITEIFDVHQETLISETA